MSIEDSLVDAVGGALDDMIRPGAGILLAVSGGSDSIGLMHLVARFVPSMRLELAVGFVDHGLREGVEAEWELVSSQARELSIEAERCAIEPGEVAEGKSCASIQQWARDVRYRELASLAARRGLGYVATGHTLDDQAETVMMRLIRGTGIDGLGGIPPRRDLSDEVQVVRPLLRAAREDIRELLRESGVSWIDDPSNDDTRFQRVRIRRELLPALEAIQPGIAGRLSALAGEARLASEFLERYIAGEKFFENLRLGEGLKVEHKVFDGLPRGAWTRLLRSALRRIRGDLLRVERTHLEPIERLILERGSGGPLPIPGEAEVHVYRGTLYAFPDPLPNRPTGSGQPAASGHGQWSARFAALGAIAEIRAPGRELVEDLEVRARRPGDRIEGSERKLKDLFGEHRVPRPYRDFVPVLASGERVVACPSLLRCRREGVEVGWVFDDDAPFLDFDFPQTGQR
jgi:tRNA(Ile)-lysidine synthase